MTQKYLVRMGLVEMKNKQKIDENGKPIRTPSKRKWTGSTASKARKSIDEEDATAQTINPYYEIKIENITYEPAYRRFFVRTEQTNYSVERILNPTWNNAVMARAIHFPVYVTTKQMQDIFGITVNRNPSGPEIPEETADEYEATDAEAQEGEI